MSEINEIKLSDDLVDVDPAISFSFDSVEETGRLTWTGKEFQFEGNAAESAKLFLEELNRQFPDKFVYKETSNG